MQVYARRCLIAVALMLAAAIWVHALWAGRASTVQYQVSFAAVPLQIGELTGQRVPVEKRIFDYLGADAMDEIEYRNAAGRRVRLSLIYGKDWRAIHSPLSCYPQQGWLVDEKREVTVAAPPGCPHPGPLRAQMLLVHQGERQQIALYVFAHQGGTTADWVAQGWAVSRSPRGTGGVSLSLGTQVVGGDVEGALDLLRKVLKNAYVPAVSFWYNSSTPSRGAKLDKALTWHDRATVIGVRPLTPLPHPGR